MWCFIPGVIFSHPTRPLQQKSEKGCELADFVRRWRKRDCNSRARVFPVEKKWISSQARNTANLAAALHSNLLRWRIWHFFLFYDVFFPAWVWKMSVENGESIKLHCSWPIKKITHFQIRKLCQKCKGYISNFCFWQRCSVLGWIFLKDLDLHYLDLPLAWCQGAPEQGTWPQLL